MKRNQRILTFGAVLAAILISVSAFAAPFPTLPGAQPTSFPGSATMGIYLSEGSNYVFVYDNQAGDSNSAVGAVTYIGSMGNWNVNVSTAVSYPVQGSTTAPYLDLNSVNVPGTGAGALTILATSGFFNTPSPAGGSLEIGGTVAGVGSTAEFEAWYCYANWPFHRDFVIASSDQFGPGAFSGSYSGALSYSNLSNYSLTIQALLEGTGPISFDSQLTVPEPSILLLLGAGLLGLAAVRRRK